MTEKEFKSRVLPFRDKLYRLAVNMVEVAEAEDVIQDVYLKLWNMRSALAAYDSTEALAMTITKNYCIDRLRSYRHRMKNDDGPEDLQMPAVGADPAKLAEMNETMRQLHAIIRQLPDRQRLVLHLRDIEQYTYEEIEKITEMSRNNIRVTLSRARKRVQKEYSKTYDYE